MTGPATRGDDQPEPLDELVMRLARRLRHLMIDAMAPWEIAPSQLRALRVVERHEGLRLTDLAGELGIAARSATEVVDALEERGLVTRVADPEDRRAVLAQTTAQGRAASAAVQQARTAEAERLFSALASADRDHLRRVLTALIDEP